MTSKRSSRFVVIAVLGVLAYITYALFYGKPTPTVVDPSWADVGKCTSWLGDVYNTTGPGSATWFVWNGCASEKQYKVNPGAQLDLHIWTDPCRNPGCQCWHPQFDVYEYTGASKWMLTKSVDLPDAKNWTGDVYYTPHSDWIMISASQCFYLRVYSSSPVTS